MKKLLLILLLSPIFLFSQNRLSEERLIEIKDSLLIELDDLEEWRSEQHPEDYFVIILEKGVNWNRWIEDCLKDKTHLDSIYQIYFDDGNTEIWINEFNAPSSPEEEEMENDTRVKSVYWNENEQDRVDMIYSSDFYEIESCIKSIDAYLLLEKVIIDEIHQEISFDWLVVECDSFGMEEWIGNWISEGVDPGEASIYENWYVVFNIVSELGIYLPLIIDHCNYDEINHVMMFGSQEIKIGEEYIIHSLDSDFGERGNGILFVTEDIEERW